MSNSLSVCSCSTQKSKKSQPLRMTRLRRFRGSQGLAGEEKGDFGEEEVGDQDRYRCDDHGLSCGATNALCSSSDGQSLIATDGSQQESKDDRLGHALHQVRKFQRVQS